MKYQRAFRRKADLAWRQAIRRRGFCLRCGRTTDLTAAHIERRRFYATRWDPGNGLCLCVVCHAWFDDRIEAGRAWLAEIRGQEALDDLRRRSRMTAWLTPDEVMAGIES